MAFGSGRTGTGESGAPAAFLFDLDGVLVDSNRMHRESWEAVAAERGLPIREAERIGNCGLRTLDVVKTYLHWEVDEAEAIRIGERKEALYRKWIRTRGIPAIPGAVGYVRAARAAGIPCAIGSSAPRENVSACLEALGLADAFGAVVNGEDVARGKPAPDIYLLAAARLGVSPERCTVFEDAAAGVAAGHAAGMKVAALLTSQSRGDLAAADAWFADFRGMPIPPVP
jgi:beta-phosphoglucomutase family hydrolase